MDISRRKFFFFGLAAGVGLLLPKEEPIFTWDKHRIDFIDDGDWIYKPTDKQVEFFNTPDNLKMLLYGGNRGGGKLMRLNGFKQ